MRHDLKCLFPLVSLDFCIITGGFDLRPWPLFLHDASFPLAIIMNLFPCQPGPRVEREVQRAIWLAGGRKSRDCVENLSGRFTGDN